MQLINQTWYLFKKEIVLEWRSKYAFNGVLLLRGFNCVYLLYLIQLKPWL